MPSSQWARLLNDTNLRLRRGAWYRILRIGPLEAVLEVNRTPLPVPRGMLQIAQQPPARWSVVPRPRNSARLPASWGPHYAVCPACRERAPLDGRPTQLRCQRCNGLFDVAWNELDRAG